MALSRGHTRLFSVRLRLIGVIGLFGTYEARYVRWVYDHHCIIAHALGHVLDSGCSCSPGFVVIPFPFDVFNTSLSCVLSCHRRLQKLRVVSVYSTVHFSLDMSHCFFGTTALGAEIVMRSSKNGSPSSTIPSTLGVGQFLAWTVSIETPAYHIAT